MTLRRLASLLVFAVGCGALSNMPVTAMGVIDPAMPRAERAAIAAAERAWLDAGAPAWRIAQTSWFMSELRPGVCGQAIPSASIIKLSWFRCKGSLNIVAIHELGHILTGPEHSPRREDVMYWQMNDAQTSLTEHDKARLK